MAKMLVIVVPNACSHIKAPAVLAERLSYKLLKDRIIISVDCFPERFRAVVKLGQSAYVKPAVKSATTVREIISLLRSAVFGA